MQNLLIKLTTPGVVDLSANACMKIYSLNHSWESLMHVKVKDGDFGGKKIL